MLELSDSVRLDILHRLKKSLQSNLRLADALGLKLVCVKLTAAMAALSQEESGRVNISPAAGLPRPLLRKSGSRSRRHL